MAPAGISRLTPVEHKNRQTHNKIVFRVVRYTSGVFTTICPVFGRMCNKTKPSCNDGSVREKHIGIDPETATN